MGCSIIGRNWTSPNERVVATPDPKKFKIVELFSYEKWLLVKIKYLEASNYEGNKVLLFEGLSIEELVEQGKKFGIDPHFMEDSKFSPIARFKPDNTGWEMAKRLILASKILS